MLGKLRVVFRGVNFFFFEVKGLRSCVQLSKLYSSASKGVTKSLYLVGLERNFALGETLVGLTGLGIV